MMYKYVVMVALLATSLVAAENKKESSVADKLIRSAPRVALSEEGIDSYRVRGVFDINGIKLRFILAARRPDQVALHIFDSQDGTPILTGSTNGFALYDPVDSKVVVGDAIPNFTFDVKKSEDGKGGELELGFGVYSGNKEDSSKDNESVVNVRDVLKMLTKNVDVRSANGGRFVLSGETDQGNRGVVTFDLERKEGACVRVELYQKGIAQPFMILDKIELNCKLSAAELGFPREKLMKSGLKVEELKSDSLLSATKLMGQLMRACLTRLILLGVDDDGIKTAVEQACGHKLDWDKLRKNDVKTGKILRKLLPVECD
jgi:hypothetical protein